MRSIKLVPEKFGEIADALLSGAIGSGCMDDVDKEILLDSVLIENKWYPVTGDGVPDYIGYDGMSFSDSTTKKLKEFGFVVDECVVDMDMWYEANRDLVWELWTADGSEEGVVTKVEIPKGTPIKVSDSYEVGGEEYLTVKIGDVVYDVYVPEITPVNYEQWTTNALGEKVLKCYNDFADIIVG